MARIIAIDYGKKRTGLAVTDPLQIIANGLDTVATDTLFDYLKTYFEQEEVETIVLGMPVNLDNSDTHATGLVKALKTKLTQTFPNKTIYTVDERFTSRMAVDTMVRGGMKKKDRRNKGNIDRISAVIILQSFLAQRDFFDKQNT